MGSFGKHCLCVSSKENTGFIRKTAENESQDVAVAPTPQLCCAALGPLSQEWFRVGNDSEEGRGVMEGGKGSCFGSAQQRGRLEPG